MKKLLNVSNALVLASMITFMACGSKDTVSINKFKEQADKLAKAKTWVSSSSTVKAPDGANTGWDNLKVVFTVDNTGKGGTYTVTGAKSGFEKVWKNEASTWKFEGDDITKIKRTNIPEPIVTIASVDGTSLNLTFTVPSSSDDRTSGIAGAWVFAFTLES